MRWNIAWATVLSCYPCWQFWQYARILRFFGRGVGFVDYTSIIKISWVIILPRMAGSVRALRIVFQAALMFLFCAWKHLPISPTCSMNSLSTGSCRLGSWSGSRWGVGGGGGVGQPPNLRKIRHYNTLIWPQNTGNPISKELNFTNLPGNDAPGSPSGEPLWRTVPRIPFSKDLDPPQGRLLYTGDLNFGNRNSCWWVFTGLLPTRFSLLRINLVRGCPMVRPI